MKNRVNLISLILLIAAIAFFIAAVFVKGSGGHGLRIIVAALGMGGIINWILFLMKPGFFKDRWEKYEDGR